MAIVQLIGIFLTSWTTISIVDIVISEKAMMITTPIEFALGITMIFARVVL